MNQALKRKKSVTFCIRRQPAGGVARSREPPVRAQEAGGVKNGRKNPSPVKRFLIKLGVMIAVCVLVHFLAGIQIHHGNRMYPFIMDGDLLISCKLGDYSKGDVVIYRNPETGKKEVSRVVASGRNEILITEEGQLLINRFAPEGQVFYPTQPLEGSEIRYPYQMEEDGFFLLDDFRTQGSDSRFFGEVTDQELLGKVVYVFRRRGI